MMTGTLILPKLAQGTAVALAVIAVAVADTYCSKKQLPMETWQGH